MVTIKDLKKRNTCLAVVGLGYVGLPLAVAFAKHFNVIGFDISAPRIAELRKGHDHTNEVSNKNLQSVDIQYSTDPTVLAKAGVVIVAVPTPIDKHKSPDIMPVVSASKTVGAHM